MRKTQWSTPLIVFLALFTLPALLALVTLYAAFKGITSEPSTPTPTPKSYTVKFKVNGTAPTVFVHGSCLHTEPYFDQVIFVLPWEKTLTCVISPMPGIYDNNISLYAAFRGDGQGSITCEIYLDGELMSSDTKIERAYSGGHSEAKCDLHSDDW